MNMADSTIDNGDGPTHATVFIWVFAVSAIWHYTSSAGEIMSYWFRYDPLVTPLVFLSIATAFIAACYPHRTAALMLMSCAQLLTIALRFPFVADHLVMELFLKCGDCAVFLLPRNKAPNSQNIDHRSVSVIWPGRALAVDRDVFFRDIS